VIIGWVFLISKIVIREIDFGAGGRWTGKLHKRQYLGDKVIFLAKILVNLKVYNQILRMYE